MNIKNGILFSTIDSQSLNKYDPSVVISLLIYDLILRCTVADAQEDFFTAGKFFELEHERLNTVTTYFFANTVCDECGSEITLYDDASFTCQLTYSAIVFLIANNYVDNGRITLPPLTHLYEEIYNSCATIVFDGYCIKCHKRDRYYCSNYDYGMLPSEEFLDIEKL